MADQKLTGSDRIRAAERCAQLQAAGMTLDRISEIVSAEENVYLSRDWVYARLGERKDDLRPLSYEDRVKAFHASRSVKLQMLAAYFPKAIAGSRPDAVFCLQLSQAIDKLLALNLPEVSAVDAAPAIAGIPDSVAILLAQLDRR